MRLLLDTHTFLWFFGGNSALGSHARELIEDPNSDLFFSAASIWEMAIKISLGKLNLKTEFPFDHYISTRMAMGEISLLNITVAHTHAIVSLPYPSGHKDPFDRMLIAQAMVERMSILSDDGAFDAYGVSRLW